MRLVGVKTKVVKEYLLTCSNLLPALADVGAEEMVAAVAAEKPAPEEEEETVSQPHPKKPKTVKFSSPKSQHKLGKYANLAFSFLTLYITSTPHHLCMVMIRKVNLPEQK